LNSSARTVTLAPANAASTNSLYPVSRSIGAKTFP
jgi:hypothetical protein